MKNRDKFEHPRDQSYNLRSNKLMCQMDDALLVRAFQVENISEDFDPSKPPSTGQEYLQHVMFEASKCPQVVVADIDRSKFENSVNVRLSDDIKSNEGSELAPSFEWQLYQVAKFSELRQKVNRFRQCKSFQPIKLPKGSEENKWYGLFFGDEDTKISPYLSVLLSMNELLLGQVLEYQVDWLENGLKPDQGIWIYAIMACISFPLTSEVCSALRDLARICAKLRCKKTSSEDPEVITLNLIICLVSKYFGQLDLAD